MVKPLHFKGDKKPKKRKRVPELDDAEVEAKYSKSVATTTAASASTSAPADDDDSWVTADVPSDVSGPILIVLPTETPTFLACDANGKVFTSEVENFVDGDPATAEPHDVRQVWVANKVAGTDNYSLKGHHGRYLSIDKYGILTATATAISPTESILFIPPPDNPSTFALQTLRETYLSIDESSTKGPEVRGDADSITFNSTFRIRMQARFKPKLRATKEEKAQAKISRKELEEIIGRRLEDDEVKKLKRARREGNFHETALDMKVKSSHDKFAS
ncbi:actin-crosslinking protein [Aaosphaeria arxii CBS 175.79]|uniref:Actin-crosslinking protein n=1 Tax=Aaosphaeria arxii CBS 175.79 TaxID=1450172 RepID=A0A6A5XY88_9PLEO|nr:actin-crosslinking protein [Aaosphaeria arxii CBS 175.79]KAF2017797.1 actin-crosslinking protein [Aaosphaeria arxii CBS 175.79]